MRSLRVMWLLVPLVLALGALYGIVSWLNKKDPVVSYDVDHIHRGPDVPAQPVTHGKFRLGKSQRFSFVVPPHAMAPRLSGEFSTFVEGAGGERLPDRSEGVELVLLNEVQYEDFARGRSVRSLYFGDPSHEQNVRIALPATQDTPERYYVVFQRASDQRSPLSVKADLNVEFETSM